MVIVFGWRRKVTLLDVVRIVCPRCRQLAAHRLLRSRRFFTLFFLPIFPYATNFVVTCTYCANTGVVDEAVINGIRAAAPSLIAPTLAGIHLHPNGRDWWDGQQWRDVKLFPPLATQPVTAQPALESGAAIG